MKNIKTYIPSLIMSVILVFSLLGTSALVTVRGFRTPDKLIQLTEEKEIVPKIKEQLEIYFSDKYNETGVPAEIYTEALTDEYIPQSVGCMIEKGIYVMKDNGTRRFDVPQNQQLEDNITRFFSDYADSIGYEKNEVYNEKLSKAIESAYDVIADYSDVYKFQTMNNEGLLTKFAKIYINFDKILLAVLASVLVISVIILLINVKGISAVLYWLGVSAMISGIIGLIPCIYLKATNYFDAFVIKQPQIFTSFTGLMYKVTDLFMLNQIILTAVGIIFVVIYSISNKKSE